MAKLQWAERLRAALHRQGLPQAYIDRLMVEFSAHADDILQETNSMDAERVLTSRLGAPDQLAEASRVQFQRRTLAGRFPILTFLIGPLVVVMGTFLLTVGLLIAGCELIDVALGGSLSANDELNVPASDLELAIMHTLNFLVRTVPFAISAWLFARLGSRSGQRRWGMVACGLIAAVAFFFFAEIHDPTAQNMATWQMGVGFRFTFHQLIQTIIPVAMAALLYRHIPTSKVQLPAVE